jgi:hypothetical protein
MDEEIGPLFLLFLGLVALVVVLVLIGIGIVIALALLVAVTILVGLGILSTSTIIGFVQRRRSFGVIAFFVQSGAVLGLPVGAAVFVLADWLSRWFLDGRLAILLGAISGLGGGAVIGLVFGVVAIRVYQWIAGRVRTRGLELSGNL